MAVFLALALSCSPRPFAQVRVPLNTARAYTRVAHLIEATDSRAVLATQNMEAGGAVPLESEIEFRALQGSLSMMSKGKSYPMAAHT